MTLNLMRVHWKAIDLILPINRVTEGGRKLRSKMVTVLVISCASLLVLALLFQLVYRPWQARWGATDEETERAMPGDAIVSDPTFDATRAVTIWGDPEDVWPWMVQIGYRKAGFYSYDWLDNDRIPSAGRIIPEYQNLAVGDSIPLSRVASIVVEVLEPNRSMLLVFRDAADEDGVWTWAWGLYPEGAGRTRLVTRLRVHQDRLTTRLMMDAFEIVMMRKCLLGIKSRVEAIE